jgi:anti-anti-sigma regulatory factor
LYGIPEEEVGPGVRVGMSGEFDAYSLPEMRGTLDKACASGKPVVVDPSGVTFPDLQSARELVVRAVMQARLTFENLSRAVLASVGALGMDTGSRIHVGQEDPPIFSEA